MPDVAVVGHKAPALIMEIMSPAQTTGNLMDKANRQVQAGAQHCWLTCPERKRAWRFTTDGAPPN